MHVDGALVLAGLIVGFVVGLTGMGGGALMTPILVLLLKVEPSTAVASDLMASLIMKPVDAEPRSWLQNLEAAWKRRLVGIGRRSTGVPKLLPCFGPSPSTGSAPWTRARACGLPRRPSRPRRCPRDRD